MAATGTGALRRIVVGVGIAAAIVGIAVIAEVATRSASG